MSIMSHLNEQNALTARENRTLPDAVLTKADILRLVDPHFDQIITLFEILCVRQAYQDRLDTLDDFLGAARRQQEFLNAERLGEIGLTSRNSYIYILRRWREDIAPLPQAAPNAGGPGSNGTFTPRAFVDGPDPVDHNPADTNLLPEDCAA